ncbi:hypothetical protein B0H11DRAFT_2234824 [Mycena galericulata]|nr:hypothetical protein B0H11DRAFT_2234824 [Mycena galericulata]
MSTVPTIESTYGAWLTSLFLETILYGIGLLQTWLYFQWWPADSWSIKLPVIVVMFLETTQLSFFYGSTYFRFVKKFGTIQGDLIWSDSVQLLANYLSAFTVQIYFASRIYLLTRARVKLHKSSTLGILVVILLALLEISAGVAQTILSYQLRSYSKLEHTKAITTLQTAASLACDIVITIYLCVFLARSKTGIMIPRTETMLNTLMINAVNRGIVTALSSGFTMILFLAYPDTFWFFLSLAPNSKLYMNSMLATLNVRQHVREKALSKDRGWNSIQMVGHGTHSRNAHGRASISAVEFAKPPSPVESDDLPEKTAGLTSCDSVLSEKT